MALVLSSWTKYLIILSGMGIIAVAALLVVCFLSPFCILNRLISCNDRKKDSDLKSKGLKKDVYGHSQSGTPIELTKLTAVQHIQYGSPEPQFAADLHSKLQSPSSLHFYKRYYTPDSCYSSLSPTTESGSRPTSPVAALVFDSDSTSRGSPLSVPEEAQPVLYGSLSILLKYVHSEESNAGHLTVTLGDCHNLPRREYHMSDCDPFMKVIVLKARTQMRKPRSHYMTLSEFQSTTVRKSRNPTFNQSFTIELTKTNIKDCALKFLIYDRDKYVNPTEIAEVMCPLAELKLQTTTSGIPMTLELGEPRQNNGEVLIGLSYLPTSERFAVNVFRAMNIRYENVAMNISSLNLEVRILLLINGKLIKKKKSCIVSGTNSPNFNFSCCFDIPISQLNQIVFIVCIAQKADVISESDDSTLSKPSRQDSCIGKVFFGSLIQSQSKCHWQSMLSSPRQQVTKWHILK